MNWVKQKIRKWLGSTNIVRESDSINARGLNFTIYGARGGKIIECRRYNQKLDRSDNILYIIHDNQDLGAEVGKIITMEALQGQV